MSLPSDVTPDIPPPETRPTLPPRRGGIPMGASEHGWIVAALVAFFGVVYLGPALARYRRAPSVRQRLARRVRATEQKARTAGVKARRRVRRWGAGRR